MSDKVGKDIRRGEIGVDAVVWTQYQDTGLDFVGIEGRSVVADVEILERGSR